MAASFSRRRASQAVAPPTLIIRGRLEEGADLIAVAAAHLEDAWTATFQWFRCAHLRVCSAPHIVEEVALRTLLEGYGPSRRESPEAFCVGFGFALLEMTPWKALTHCGSAFCFVRNQRNGETKMIRGATGPLYRVTVADVQVRALLHTFRASILAHRLQVQLHPIITTTPSVEGAGRLGERTTTVLAAARQVYHARNAAPRVGAHRRTFPCCCVTICSTHRLVHTRAQLPSLRRAKRPQNDLWGSCALRQQLMRCGPSPHSGNPCSMLQAAAPPRVCPSL